MREIHIRDNLGYVFVYDGRLGAGLPDANNVEIFEGDWVKVPGYQKLRQVVWRKGGLFLKAPGEDVVMGIMPNCVVVKEPSNDDPA